MLRDIIQKNLPLNLRLCSELFYYFLTFTFYLAAPGRNCDMQDLLVAACELLVVTCGIKFPAQELNPDFLLWDHGVLATEQPRKSTEQLYVAH